MLNVICKKTKLICKSQLANLNPDFCHCTSKQRKYKLSQPNFFVVVSIWIYKAFIIKPYSTTVSLFEKYSTLINWIRCISNPLKHLSWTFLKIVKSFHRLNKHVSGYAIDDIISKLYLSYLLCVGNICLLLYSKIILIFFFWYWPFHFHNFFKQKVRTFSGIFFPFLFPCST